MSICIITDDNSGFTHEEAENLGITVLRMPIIIDGETFFENETIDTNTFYEKMNNGADIKTSQPSRKDIIDLWTEKLKTYDQILHIPMSSGLSNSCDNAKVLAQEFDGKVVVVDNHRISVTLKAAVRDAIALSNKGLDANAIKAKLEETAFDSTIYIMVDTLKYLKKGGRITPAAALIGEMVSIKPVLTLLGEKLDSFKKTIGVKKAKVVEPPKEEAPPEKEEVKEEKPKIQRVEVVKPQSRLEIVRRAPQKAEKPAEKKPLPRDAKKFPDKGEKPRKPFNKDGKPSERPESGEKKPIQRHIISQDIYENKGGSKRRTDNRKKDKDFNSKKEEQERISLEKAAAQKHKKKVHKDEVVEEVKQIVVNRAMTISELSEKSRKLRPK